MSPNAPDASTRSPRRDVVVRCSGGGHKVRLAGGRRLWARARCPVCRAPVDPSRLHRLGRVAANLRLPATAHRLDRGLWGATLGYLGFAVAVAVLLWTLADRWWPATVLLYAPRWVFLLPLAPLAVGAWARDRALLLPWGVTLLVVLMPVMGFRTGWRTALVRADEARDMTVVTFNARGGGGLSVGPQELMLAWSADVAAFQECGQPLRDAIRGMAGWHVDVEGSLCLVSRFEILEAESMEREVIRSAGGSGLVRSYLLRGDDAPFRLTNLHLDTPRAGLELIRSGRILAGIRRLEQKSLLRHAELTRARRFAEERSGPHVVAGDFNTPDESRAYRQAFGGWTNAFAVAGFGVGGTRLNGWIRARIDHVVVDDAWRVVDARPGEDVGSDHLPMVAELRPR